MEGASETILCGTPRMVTVSPKSSVTVTILSPVSVATGVGVRAGVVVVAAAVVGSGVVVAGRGCRVSEGVTGYGFPRSAGIAFAVILQGLSVT